jgi:hypothetical protein
MVLCCLSNIYSIWYYAIEKFIKKKEGSAIARFRAGDPLLALEFNST